MKWAVFPAVLLLLTATLAGCADSGAGTEETDFDDIDVEATEDTGIMLGVVVDEGIRPLPGVTISLSPSEKTATTDEVGRFAFGDLEPGQYFVAASKLGYITTQQTVEVVAGVETPDIVRMLLETDPEARPFVDVNQFDGFIECSFTLFLVSFAACALAEDYNNNVFIDYVSWDPNVKHIQSEMVWQSTQALGDDMSLSLTDPSSGVQLQINASAGPSPLLLTVNASTIEEFELESGKEVWLRVFSTSREGTAVADSETWNEPWRSTIYPTYNSTAPQEVKDLIEAVAGQTGANPVGEDCVKWAALFDACFGVGGFGATLQQEYTVYTHSFYNFLPPLEWRFTADGAPDLPA